MRRTSPSDWDGRGERVHPDPAADPLARWAAEADVRRGHHRRRRARPVHGVPPRHAARHHERRGHRGRLHRSAATPAATRRSSAANYGIPESIRFYQHSLERYQALEEETGAAILHQTKGVIWLAHTEMAMRTERARCAMNQARRRPDVHAHAGGAQVAHPAARPDRWRSLSGPRWLASRRGRDGAPRSRRVGLRAAWRRSGASTSSSTRR